LAALRACRESARLEAALWPSRFKAREVARERLADFFALFFFPFLRSRAACLRIFFEPFFGTANFTPARRAFEVDIGNAIKPFYGAAAGDQLTALLKEHITTAAEIVAAARQVIKQSRTTQLSVGLRMPTPLLIFSARLIQRTGRRLRCER
jgi:hypothetical protein